MADLGYYDSCYFPGIIWNNNNKKKTLIVNTNSVESKGKCFSLKIDQQIFNERLHDPTKLSRVAITSERDYTYLTTEMSPYVHTRAYINLYAHIFVSLSIK